MGDVNFFLWLAFAVFTIITLGGALGVVTTRNLFRGTIWLMVSLFGVAGYYVLLETPFLAAVQVLVYIGAIAILFTFAVMLTRSLTSLTDRYNRPIANIVGAVLLFVLLMGGIVLPIWYPEWLSLGQPWQPDPSIISATVQDTADLGAALVDKEGFVLPFEVVSLLLTAAMIGAIVIAREIEEDEKGKRG